MPVDVKLIEVREDQGGITTQTVVDTFPAVTWPGVLPVGGGSFPADAYLPDQDHVGWVASWSPRIEASGTQVEEWPGTGSVKRIHIQNLTD